MSTAARADRAELVLVLGLLLGKNATAVEANSTDFWGGAGRTGESLERSIRHATEDRVGTAAAQVILSSHGELIYYAMARDGLFCRFAGRVHPRYHAPEASLIVQRAWASLLTLSGAYSQLLDHVTLGRTDN